MSGPFVGERVRYVGDYEPQQGDVGTVDDRIPFSTGRAGVAWDSGDLSGEAFEDLEPLEPRSRTCVDVEDLRSVLAASGKDLTGYDTDIALARLISDARD